MLASGVVGLLTGDRRSDRLLFCRQEAGPRFTFSGHLFVRVDGWGAFVSSCLRRTQRFISVPSLCLCASVVLPTNRSNQGAAGSCDEVADL